MCRKAGLKVGKKGDQCFGSHGEQRGAKATTAKGGCHHKDELSQFLGLCGYYRRFILSFADITSSLFGAIKKDIQCTKVNTRIISAG